MRQFRAVLKTLNTHITMFNFLKRKELEEIKSLKEKISEAGKEKQQLLSYIGTLKDKCSRLEKYTGIVDIELEKEKVIQKLNIEIQKSESERLKREEDAKNHINRFKKDISDLEKEISDLEKQIDEKKGQIVELDDQILLQEYGLYSPIYDFANLDGYRERLNQIREDQKEMIRQKIAATCSIPWTVDGSKTKGQAMVNQSIKQIIRCFNGECDVLIDKVKFNNVTSFIDKIKKSAIALNNMNTRLHISLSDIYIESKIDELKLAYEYARKKEDEKEEQRRIREQLREEARLQKEIEEARKNVEKEQKHYAIALEKVNEQLSVCNESSKAELENKKSEIEKRLSELDAAMKDMDYREANKRAGYVYVISNIGSFGEDVYKIGMTRRLDPIERVDELGDASVPFKFDIHAMIFSEDAPSLESALHKAFEDRKVNMVNPRREFFRVSLEEIENVVKNNYDKTVQFVKVPRAEQFRESQRMKG